jgi:hypothetical protein
VDCAAPTAQGELSNVKTKNAGEMRIDVRFLVPHIEFEKGMRERRPADAPTQLYEQLRSADD